MGAHVRFPSGAIESTAEPRVVLSFEAATSPPRVRKLTLSDTAPLDPLVMQDGGRPWPVGDDPRLVLKDGVYEVSGQAVRFGRPPSGLVAPPELRYLWVNEGAAQFVSLARGLDLLGATEALRTLGLDDAAIALVHGDLDGARLQWLRFKEQQSEGA